MSNAFERNRPRPRNRPREAGAVLLTVLLVMVTLLGLGITALWMTTTGMQIGANTNMRNQALYVAEMGIEAVRKDLNTLPLREIDLLLKPNGLNPSPNKCWDGTVPDLNDTPFRVVPNGSDAGDDTKNAPTGYGVVFEDQNGRRLCNVPFPTGPDNGITRTGTTPRMGSYTVFIRNDNMELRKNVNPI